MLDQCSYSVLTCSGLNDIYTEDKDNGLGFFSDESRFNHSHNDSHLQVFLGGGAFKRRLVEKDSLGADNVMV